MIFSSATETSQPCSGTPPASRVQNQKRFFPGVCAALRPPATLWQPAGLRRLLNTYRTKYLFSVSSSEGGEGDTLDRYLSGTRPWGESKRMFTPHSGREEAVDAAGAYDRGSRQFLAPRWGALSSGLTQGDVPPRAGLALGWYPPTPLA